MVPVGFQTCWQTRILIDGIRRIRSPERWAPIKVHRRIGALGICIREHHKEQRTIYTQATLFLAMNRLPSVHGDCQDRVRALPVQKVLVDSPSKPYHLQKRSPQEISAQFERVDVQDAIVAVVLEAYQRSATEETAAGFAEAAAYTRRVLADITALDLDEYISKGGPGVSLDALLVAVNAKCPDIGIGMLVEKLEANDFQVRDDGVVPNASLLSTPAPRPSPNPGATGMETESAPRAKRRKQATNASELPRPGRDIRDMLGTK